MSASTDLGLDRLEDAVRRLQELYDAAAGDDRTRVALLLGLAIADLVAKLPDGDARQAELAARGLARLDEAGDSPDADRSRAVLARIRAASQGPANFRIAGGQLDWDVDWAGLLGPSEAARNLTAMLPTLAANLPPQLPLRKALLDICEVLNSFDRGDWSPTGDAALASAIRQVELAGLGSQLGPMLRLIAMVIRTRRCMLSEQEGRRPDWPSLAELDALIVATQADNDWSEAFTGPFQGAAGMEHMFLGLPIVMRIMVDIKSPHVRRDTAWRDRLLELVAQADECLSKMPPSHVGPVQQMRRNLDKVSAALHHPTLIANLLPADQAPAPAPAPAPPAPAPAPPEPPAESPAEPLTGMVVDSPDERFAWQLDGALSQLFSPQGVAGFQVLAEAVGGARITAMSRLMIIVQAMFARRWTPEAEHELETMRQEAMRLADDGDLTLSDRALIASAFDIGRVAKWQLTSHDPRPGEHPPPSETAGIVAEIEETLKLVSAATAEDSSSVMLRDLAVVLHAEAATLLVDLAGADLNHPDPALTARVREHMAYVSPEIFDKLPPALRDVLEVWRMAGDDKRATTEHAARLAQVFPEVAETTGLLFQAAEHACAEAKQRRDLDSIGVALNELNKSAIALPAGNPQHIRRLVLQAEMQCLLAMHLSSPVPLADAIGAAFDAARSTSEPAVRRNVAHRLAVIFELMTLRGYRDGPFEQAEELLRKVLADAAADDWPLRVLATVALGAARAMRAMAAGDRAGHDAASALIADAEAMLPEPTPSGDWYDAARTIHSWTTVHSLKCPGACLTPTALRFCDLLEDLLASQPGAAGTADGRLESETNALRQARETLAAQSGQSAGTSAAGAAAEQPPQAADVTRLAHESLERAFALLGRIGPERYWRVPLGFDGRSSAAALQEAMTDLHAALGGLFSDSDLRRRLDETLGRCAAELFWADPAARTIATLQEAVSHLNRTLSAGTRALPVADRAEVLHLLARCRHEVALRHDVEAERVEARAEADRACRAALRELARCVLLTPEAGRAAEIASVASGVVARGIGWCLADGNHRAAVEIAEAGRGLVLTAAVLAGRVEEVLRGAGRDDVADQWRQGSEAGRLEALEALWNTSGGAAMLASPNADEVSVMLATTRFDAVVYLVPPAPDDGWPSGDDSPASHVGHAVLVRPLTSNIEVLPLPGLDGEDAEPFDAYLTALDGALASIDTTATGPDGFRGGPFGQAWADALVRLGSWAYDRIMGPLINHVDGWDVGRRPHLALIPLGKLAAIPYATAWTGEEGKPGAARYAIDNVTLTYAASARLLGEVSRRAHQPLGSRVVLVSDPLGGFPMTRRATRVLASRQYRRAENYGLRSAPDGPATSDVLLGALPGTDRPGASLLQVATHGTTDPVPQLQTYDGWLPLRRILDQARGRPPAAPGGLIITNACLTDSTRTNHDESLTLATALLAAGATDVIGTRWPVDDDTTAALSLRLHYHLQLGKTPPEALRSAQLDLLRPTPDIRESLGRDLAAIEPSRLSHPASWAGYVHHGADTRPSVM